MSGGKEEFLLNGTKKPRPIPPPKPPHLLADPMRERVKIFEQRNGALEETPRGSRFLSQNEKLPPNFSVRIVAPSPKKENVNVAKSPINVGSRINAAYKLEVKSRLEEVYQKAPLKFGGYISTKGTTTPPFNRMVQPYKIVEDYSSKSNGNGQNKIPTGQESPTQRERSPSNGDKSQFSNPTRERKVSQNTGTTPLIKEKTNQLEGKINLSMKSTAQPIIGYRRIPSEPKLSPENRVNTISRDIKQIPVKSVIQLGPAPSIPPRQLKPPLEQRSLRVEQRAGYQTNLHVPSKFPTVPKSIPRQLDQETSYSKPLPSPPKNLKQGNGFNTVKNPPKSSRPSLRRAYSLPDITTEERDSILFDWVITPKEPIFPNSTPPKSINDTPFVRESQIFGVNLQELLERDCTKIPKIVVSCCDFIKKYGLDTKGIFRTSPDYLDLQKFTNMFNQGEIVDFEQLKMDVHLVCGILKKYLRDLPPLLTYENYTCFIAVHAMPMRLSRIKSANFDDEFYLQKMKGILQMLPNQNLELIKYLLDFLTDVSIHDKENGMNVGNLAMVFAPLLLRTTESIQENPDLIGEMGSVVEICHFLIVNKDKLF